MCILIDQKKPSCIYKNLFIRSVKPLSGSYGYRYVRTDRDRDDMTGPFQRRKSLQLRLQ